jgi:squalene monooxygenase
MIMLGDAMNMRHPLTGGGMTVALKDVVLLGAMLSPTEVPLLDDTGAVLEQMRKFHWKRKEFSTSLNILAQALYVLFVADGISPPTPLRTVSANSN